MLVNGSKLGGFLSSSATFIRWPAMVNDLVQPLNGLPCIGAHADGSQVLEYAGLFDFLPCIRFFGLYISVLYATFFLHFVHYVPFYLGRSQEWR
jgi:hypothetical protein